MKNYSGIELSYSLIKSGSFRQIIISLDVYYKRLEITKVKEV